MVKKNKRSLVFEFMKMSDMEKLNSQEKVDVIIKTVKENKIILVEGRFKKQEEAHLIQKTMEQINNNFKGIEIAVVNPSRNDSSLFQKIKGALAIILLGEREGFTLIGPATIITEIKQDPYKLNQLSINLN
jgi:hypothetical protein